MVVAFAPDQEVGQQAALGRAEAGAAEAVGGEVLHVIGQQVVEEVGGVLAIGANHAHIPEGSDDGGSCQFGSSLAKAEAIGGQAVAAQGFNPVGAVHGVSLVADVGLWSVRAGADLVEGASQAGRQRVSAIIGG